MFFFLFNVLWHFRFKVLESLNVTLYIFIPGWSTLESNWQQLTTSKQSETTCVFFVFQKKQEIIYCFFCVFHVFLNV